jgi:DnaJ family protein A protein 2
MSQADEPDLYALLGVAPDAPRAEIVRAFRRRALTHHPDRGGDPEAFRRLRRAYETLRDPERRTAYDRRRPTPEAHTPPPPADPFAWAPGAGPRTGDHGVHTVPFPAPGPGGSWRRVDRFAWWEPAEEPRPKGRRRRR